jgi:hypothetical protein
MSETTAESIIRNREQLTPYAGTSGWSGTETSRQRAEHDDTTGLTGKRQREALTLVHEGGSNGMTVKELRYVTGWHHGQASSVLTLLHKAGAIQRLSATRDRCKVYVHPDSVLGRETEAVASRHARTREFYPRREDKVAVWLKECRDQHLTLSASWLAIDALLNQYRLDADTGSELGKGREG